VGNLKNYIRDKIKKPYVDRNGYELRYRPESPSANGRGYAHTHRVVAEQKVGGPIYEGRVVHHRDGDKRNNNSGNLQVMSRSRHGKIHKMKSNYKKGGKK